MPLYPILLILAVVAADGGLAIDVTNGRWGSWPGLLVAMVPVLAADAVVAVVVTAALRSMRSAAGPQGIRRAERVITAARWFLLLNHAAAVLLFGWLAAVRGLLGDLVVLDELVCIAPPVVGIMGVWWVQYPLERRIRDAMLISRLDTGSPIYPMPQRWAYVMLRARSELLLLLVPVLTIVALAEVIDWTIARPFAATWPDWVADAAKLGAAAAVFLFAPLTSRVLLHVRPLEPGPQRDSLLAVCRQHKVRVRDILLWDTHGTIINAAVMGVVGPLRYVLLTDAMLELMSKREVLAVMAHEVAHVRRHHVPWLVVALLAAVSVTIPLFQLPLFLAEGLGWSGRVPTGGASVPIWLQIALTAGQIAAALLVFGWVSRRFERQADTFAVGHLSGSADGAEVIQPEAVDSLRSALSRIAHLNHIDPRRPSWRHGSIAWRLEYLSSIIGRPIADLPIDRLVRWIKLIAALVLAGTIAAEFGWIESSDDSDAGATMSAVAFHSCGSAHPAK